MRSETTRSKERRTNDQLSGNENNEMLLSGLRGLGVGSVDLVLDLGEGETLREEEDEERKEGG